MLKNANSCAAMVGCAGAQLNQRTMEDSCRRVQPLDLHMLARSQTSKVQRNLKDKNTDAPKMNVSSELLHEPNPGRSVGDFHVLDAEHGADNAGVPS